MSLDENPHHYARSRAARISDRTAVTCMISDRAGDDIGVLRMTIGRSSVPGTAGELTTLYLLPQARGLSIGSNLIACGRAETARQGARVVAVCVLAGNQRGRSFYQRHGAHQIGDRIAFRFEDQPIPEILYQLG
jgi:ribosomal protein S18 acetylase RimI-like enzyme